MDKYVFIELPGKVLGIYTDLKEQCESMGLDRRTVARYIESEGYYMRQGVLIVKGPYYKSKRGGYRASSFN